MVTIEKKDWLTAKTQFENLLINAMVNIECYKSALEAINKKIDEFPDEEKTIKEELKQDFEKLIA